MLLKLTLMTGESVYVNEQAIDAIEQEEDLNGSRVRLASASVRVAEQALEIVNALDLDVLDLKEMR